MVEYDNLKIIIAVSSISLRQSFGGLKASGEFKKREETSYLLLVKISGC